MLDIKATVNVFQSYISVKSMDITANKSIIERAILVDESGKTKTRSYFERRKNEGRPSIAKKSY